MVSLKTWRLIQETSEKSCFIKSQHKLDKCCYWSLMEKLDTSSIYRIYNFRISRSKIWPIMTWMIRVSLLTTLVIYKPHTWKQRLKTHTLYGKLLRLCTLGFCNQVLPDLHRLIDCLVSLMIGNTFFPTKGLFQYRSQHGSNQF